MFLNSNTVEPRGLYTVLDNQPEIRSPLKWQTSKWMGANTRNLKLKALHFINFANTVGTLKLFYLFIMSYTVLPGAPAFNTYTTKQTSISIHSDIIQ